MVGSFAVACSLTPPSLSETEGGAAGGRIGSGGSTDSSGGSIDSSGGSTDGSGGSTDSSGGSTDGNGGSSGSGGGSTDGNGGSGGLEEQTGGHSAAGGSAVVGAPSRLAFSEEPGSGTTALAFPAKVSVAVQDDDGNVATDSSVTITLSLEAASNPSQAALEGTLSRAAVNGVATFTDLRVTRSGPSLKLAASAPNVESSTSAPFAMNAWRETGPEGGSPAFLADTGTVAYAAFQKGTQIYRWTPSEARWVAGGAGAPPWVEAMAVSAKAPSTVYLGGRPAKGSSESSCYRSTDGGQTFSIAKSGMTPPDCTVLATDPSSETTVYAASGQRIHRSVNGGESWTLVTDDASAGTIKTLAVDPVTPTRLYAGGYKAARSIDGGQTWDYINTGFTGEVTQIVIDPRTPAILYAAKLADDRPPFLGGIYRSQDGGDSWEDRSTALPGGGRSFCYSVAVDPLVAGRLFAICLSTSGTERGLYVSTDSGASWLLHASTEGSAMTMNPTTGALLYPSSGELQRLYWPSRTDRMTAGMRRLPVASLAADTGLQGTILAGIPSGSARTTNGGDSWATLAYPIGMALQSFAFVPGASNLVYAASPNASWRSDDGAGTWWSVNGTTTWRPRQIVVARREPLRIVGGSTTLLASLDGGSTYSPICDTPGRCPTTTLGSMVQVLVSPQVNRTLYASGAAQVATPIWRSADDGQTWSRLSDFTGSLLAVDAGGILYATDTGANLFRSDAAVTSWSLVLPNSSPRLLHVDRKARANIYYVDGSHSIFKSKDAGTTWSPAQSGIARTTSLAITALEADGAGRLYVGTEQDGIFESWSGGE